jgi:mannitol/fructose-specific phosphotransferase system IIA component (Ntr-type)
MSALPLVRILLSMAETVVESGTVKNPLEYYKELANQSSPWIADPETNSVPHVKVYQICSRGVKKLTAALALCPEGVRSDQGETVHIVFLISAPSDSVPAYLALLAQVLRILKSAIQREALLRSNSPEEAWALLSQLEAEPESAPQPRN